MFDWTSTLAARKTFTFWNNWSFCERLLPAVRRLKQRQIRATWNLSRRLKYSSITGRERSLSSVCLRLSFLSALCNTLNIEYSSCIYTNSPRQANPAFQITLLTRARSRATRHLCSALDRGGWRALDWTARKMSGSISDDVYHPTNFQLTSVLPYLPARVLFIGAVCMTNLPWHDHCGSAEECDTSKEARKWLMLFLGFGCCVVLQNVDVSGEIKWWAVALCDFKLFDFGLLFRLYALGGGGLQLDNTVSPDLVLVLN